MPGISRDNRVKVGISKCPDCFFHFSTLFSGSFFTHSLFPLIFTLYFFTYLL